MPVMSLPPGVSDAGLQHATGYFNLVAILVSCVITTILVIGIKESANFNSAIVIVKLTIVGIFLVLGGYFLFKHPALGHAQLASVYSAVGRARELWLGRHCDGAASRSSLPISDLTRCRRRRRRRRIRSGICRSAFSARWWSARCCTSWFRWC